LYEVSSMVIVLSPSPTSRRSFTLPFPSAGTSSGWGRGWIGDELHDVILQYTIHMSTTTLGKLVHGGSGHDY
jgi:hypothetical protein